MQMVIDIPKSLYANLQKIQNGSIAAKKILECVRNGKRADVPDTNVGECEDCISRQAVLEVIRKCHCEEWVKADIGAPIEALPPVTPAKKMGHWEWVQYDGNPNIGNWHCSECQCIVEDGKPSYKYCPQCGCRMQEVADGTAV